MCKCTKKEKLSRVAGVIAIIFGILTIIQGGRTLFDPAVHDVAGKVVPFVLKYNFIAGFFYIPIGILVFRMKYYAKYFAILLGAANGVVFFQLTVHVFSDLPYEPKTYFAMMFRLLLWALIATLSLSFEKPTKD